MDIHPFRMVHPMRSLLDRSIQQCLALCPSRLTRLHDALRTHAMYNGVSHAAVLRRVAELLQECYRDGPVSCVSWHFHKAQLDASRSGVLSATPESRWHASSTAEMSSSTPSSSSSPAAMRSTSAHTTSSPSHGDAIMDSSPSARTTNDVVVVSTDNLFLIPRFLRALHHYPVNCRVWQRNVESLMVAHVQRLTPDEVSSEECVQLWAVVASCLHWPHAERLLQHFPLVQTLPMLSREEFHTVLSHVCVRRTRLDDTDVSVPSETGNHTKHVVSNAASVVPTAATTRWAERIVHEVMDVSLLWRRCAEEVRGAVCRAEASWPETIVCSCLLLAGLTCEWRVAETQAMPWPSAAVSSSVVRTVSATVSCANGIHATDSCRSAADSAVVPNSSSSSASSSLCSSALASSSVGDTHTTTTTTRTPLLTSLHAHNLPNMCDRLRVMLRGYDILPCWAQEALRQATTADVWRYTSHQGVEFTCGYWVWWFDRHDYHKDSSSSSVCSRSTDRIADVSLSAEASLKTITPTMRSPDVRVFLRDCLAAALREQLSGSGSDSSRNRLSSPCTSAPISIDVVLKASVAAAVLQCREKAVCEMLLQTLVHTMRQLLTHAVCTALRTEEKEEEKGSERTECAAADRPETAVQTPMQKRPAQLPPWSSRLATSLLWTRWQPSFTGYALAAAEYLLRALSEGVEHTAGHPCKGGHEKSHDSKVACERANCNTRANYSNDHTSCESTYTNTMSCYSSFEPMSVSPQYEALKEELLDMSRAVLTRRVWQRRGCARLVALLLLHAPHLTRELGLVPVCLTMLRRHARDGFTRDQLSSIRTRYRHIGDGTGKEEEDEDDSVWRVVRQVMDEIPLRGTEQDL